MSDWFRLELLVVVLRIVANRIVVWKLISEVDVYHVVRTSLQLTV
jgi:hypothetical protein